jgi:phosphotransferase system enzyme I (PtsI)
MEATNTNECTIKGRGVGSGLVIGDVFVLELETQTVQAVSIEPEEVKHHKSRFFKAKSKLANELSLMSKDLDDPNSSKIIGTQKQIIEDVEIEKNVLQIIEEELLCVEHAIFHTYDVFIEKLKESASELFRQRIVDLENIRDQFVNQVTAQKHKKSVAKGSIIIAKQISPTDLVSFYEAGAIGLVMEKGGVTSHAAIIAKSLGIPCMVNVDRVTKKAENKDKVILDAAAGTLILSPTKTTLKQYKKRAKALRKMSEKKEAIIFKTADDGPYTLQANIEFEAELAGIAENGAKGIGLLRTESLLFGSTMRKSVEDQEAFYSNILSGMKGQVTIRLFDIGGDKTGGRTIKESNPFLGWRGIRLLLDKKQLLRDQLRAILITASKYPGRIRILVPMVSMMDEVKAIKNEIAEVFGVLQKEGVELTEHVPLGLMVEVPSVALMAHHFAKEVDFLSIGTNDLTQYTLAVDRGNERISSLFQHYHPSVLRLIKMTAEGAKKAGIEVSVCGELAGNEVGAAFILGAGIGTLSMPPSSIQKINGILRNRTQEEFQAFAQSALTKTSAAQVEQLFEEKIGTLS